MSYYGLAALASFQVLAYELALFHLLTYQFSYLYGVLGLSLALGGLGLGAARAIPLTRRLTEPDWLEFAVLRLYLQFNLGLLAVPAICLLPLPTLATLLLLGLVYVPAGVLLSLVFATQPPERLYAWDLAGAGAATLAFPFLWSQLGHENFPTALAGLGLAAVGGQALRIPGLRARRRLVAGSLGLALVAGGWVFANFQLGVLNFAMRLPANPDFPWKIFNLPPREREVILSRPDLVQRIEFVPELTTARDAGYETYYDGLRIDLVRPDKGRRFDVRMAGCLDMTDPRILVIGTAAQGVVKPAKVLAGDPARVTGLEINRATIGLMENELYTYSRKAYQGIDLQRVDGRTFLERPGPAFDLITLLNTHTVHDIGEALTPDYLHTKEGLQAALARLTPRGFLSLEERNPNDSSQKSIDSLLETVREALHASGRRPAGAHIIIYEWFGAFHKTLNEDRFLQILVSNEPFAPAEIAWMKAFEKGARVETPGLEENMQKLLNFFHLPDGSVESGYSVMIRGWEEDKASLHGPPALTDDRPYPGVVFWKAPAWRWLLGCLALLLLLATLVAALDPYGLKADFAVCALTGIANAILQTVLLQRLQLVTGSPASALAAVLGGLFLAGALGSLGLAHRPLSRARRTAGVVLGGVAMAVVLSAPLPQITPLHFYLRLALVWLGVAPLAFVLGSFLPALSLRAGLVPHAARLFAVSSLAGAAAAPLCLVVSVTAGHRAALGLAAAAALLAVALWPKGQA